MNASGSFEYHRTAGPNVKAHCLDAGLLHLDSAGHNIIERRLVEVFSPRLKP